MSEFHVVLFRNGAPAHCPKCPAYFVLSKKIEDDVFRCRICRQMYVPTDLGLEQVGPGRIE
jgi:hypothetical protein